MCFGEVDMSQNRDLALPQCWSSFCSPFEPKRYPQETHPNDSSVEREPTIEPFGSGPITSQDPIRRSFSYSGTLGIDILSLLATWAQALVF